jgi:hypothetical protein
VEFCSSKKSEKILSSSNVYLIFFSTGVHSFFSINVHSVFYLLRVPSVHSMSIKYINVSYVHFSIDLSKYSIACGMQNSTSNICNF